MLPVILSLYSYCIGIAALSFIPLNLFMVKIIAEHLDNSVLLKVMTGEWRMRILASNNTLLLFFIDLENVKVQKWFGINVMDFKCHHEFLL